MGLPITREEFADEDYVRFSEKLRDCAEALRTVVDRPGFGVGPATIGAELELNLVGDDGRPMGVNRAVLADTLDGRVTLEVNRFNLEINARPTLLAGTPFANMAAELEDALAETRSAARAQCVRVATIGILPTLTESDLQSSALTDGARYRALSAGIMRLRGEPFAVDIEGEDKLTVTAHDVTFEGANTSFQLHLRVSPQDFARTYNAAQMAIAPVLATSANSPLFFGRRLWQETRIALFRQAVDLRTAARGDDWRPARVSFGHGWVRSGAPELFEESVFLHEPLLPVISPEDPCATAQRGGVPTLAELRLHQSTVWRWNRAIYDDAAGGHLRIEMRALPAGPTVRDMIASAAFGLGLTLGLAPDMERMMVRTTFGHVRRNFYEAARQGLEARLLWPTNEGPSPRIVHVSELLPHLLLTARRGLVGAGVDAREADEWLAVVARRTERGVTGASWQRRAFDRLAAKMDWQAAASRMLSDYMALSDAGDPVDSWPDLP
jgi:hypothetical protein